MRVVPFLISAVVTAGLIIALDVQFPSGTAKTPRFGYFLSPQKGFWQNAEPVDISYNVDIKLPGLTGNVQVAFDERLVPHVYADNEQDLYYVQGYLHAKFRLWQMDFQTRVAAGRLSEITGKTNISIDRFFRRLGMVYAAENSQKAAEANPITKMEMDAYTAGVNAYINALKPSDYPLEYKLLNYKPEAWTNLKTSLFLKFMSFDLASYEMDFELTNARRILGAVDFEKLYPIIQDSLVPIIPKGTVFAAPGVVAKPPATLDSTLFNNNIDTSATTAFVEPKADPDNGSNNWAVGGTKTKSGRPILANDPHLGLNLPSLWYEMQLSSPQMNVYGVTFPGAPSVIIGFNDSCAWGVTNAGRDVRDYYEIRFKDSTMQEYWFNNQWTKAETRKEVIKVSDSAELTENIAMTVFGPVMYDTKYPSRLKDGKYYACRWKAHDPSNELLTFNKLNKAKNYSDYLEAISTFQTPGQNFLFASKTGDVAIKQQGQFPAKWMRQGDFIMPGQDSSHMWQGFIPVNENPSQFNHPRGYASSANQLPVDATYPYYLSGSFPPYRGISVNKQLDAMNNITPDDMMRLQTDNYNVFAATAMPLLLKYIDESILSEKQKEYFQLVKSWNLRNDVGEKGATIFKLWWDSLEVFVFKDEIDKLNGISKWPDESTLVEGLLKDSTDYLFLKGNGSTTNNLRMLVTAAFGKACAKLEMLKSHNTPLEWGGFKNTGVRHLLRIPALSRLGLNIGGGEHIINATKQYHGPSWRVIVHLTDDIEAYGVYPGGQNGNPGSKYYDTFIDHWTTGKYYPLVFIRKEEADKTNKIKWRMTFTKA